jgi:hypothetical protein
VDTSGAKPKPSRAKRWRQNILLLLFSTTITLLAGEFVVRWAIYSDGDGFKNLKDAGNYFYVWDTDYWKMVNLLDSNSRAPLHPHPFLGWTEKVNLDTYYHGDAPKVGQRRPVLLYGDSFSACVDEVKCFEDILNADSAFTRDNYLLNYGVGGYGVCQASLLCRKTAPHYQKPLVVFGLLNTDLDRTPIPWRCGQKPYYDVVDGKLALQGLPIDSVASHYFDTHPIGTTSYLFRLFLKSQMNFLPYRVTTWFDEKEKSIAHIEEVNRLLITQFVAELRAKQIDFVFLVFHSEDNMLSQQRDDNWRDQFLRKTLAENSIPYIWTKDIIRDHRLAHPENTHETYLLPGNGHPTTLYNQLICAEIQKLATTHPAAPDFRPDTLNDELYETRAWRRAQMLRRDSAAMQDVAAKAQAAGHTVDEQVLLEARFLMNLELNAENPFAPDGVFEGKWSSK